MKKASIRIDGVSPIEAQQYLSERLEDQRNVRQSHVNNLATEMINGKFRLSCDAIVLLKGKLANGQHRLEAVVASGVKCQFLIMETDDDELYKIIDCGIKRTTGDALIKISYSHLVGAVSGWMVKYESKVLTHSGYRWGSKLKNQKKDRNFDATITRSNILEYAEEHSEEIVKAIQLIKPLSDANRILSATLAVSGYLLGSRKHPDLAKKFITTLYTGNEKDTVANDLRERLIKDRISKAKLRPQYVFGLMIKAMNAAFKGERPGTLKIADDEEFPKL
jgi:hypothetical protein